MGIDRDAVVAALRPEDVARHLGIEGQFRGRWMRASRCAETDHATDAFGLARDGHWHCWSCDKGGDLLALLALGEGLDVRSKEDFPKVLALAAQLAGVDEECDFGAPDKPAPRPRPELPAPVPLGERIAIAKKRAFWLWDHLWDGSMVGDLPDLYLRSRGLSAAQSLTVLQREPLRYTPMRIPPELRARIDAGDPGVNQDLRTIWYTMGVRRGTLSVVVPVRSVDDGKMIDLRARRVEPLDGQPKIIGMVGGVTASPAERGKTRQLLGCYGHPNRIESEHVVCVEGALDYLTSLAIWPNAQVLGAVDAGSLSLVVGLAARCLAAQDNTSRLTIVEQADPPRVLKDGRVVAGAADESVNESVNAATKVAVRHLGPRRVGWLYCSYPEQDGTIDRPRPELGGKPVKDLNDLVKIGADVADMIVWWDRIGGGAAHDAEPGE